MEDFAAAIVLSAALLSSGVIRSLWKMRPATESAQPPATQAPLELEPTSSRARRAWEGLRRRFRRRPRPAIAPTSAEIAIAETLAALSSRLDRLERAIEAKSSHVDTSERVSAPVVSERRSPERVERARPRPRFPIRPEPRRDEAPPTDSNLSGAEMELIAKMRRRAS